MKIINVYEQVSPDLPVQLSGVAAKGLPMLTNGKLGVDLLYLEPDQSFPLHTHPGDHLLLVIAGAGSVTIGSTRYPTRPGDLYMVPGGENHAVEAGPEGHYLLSFGAPHYHLSDPERMKVTGQE